MTWTYVFHWFGRFARLSAAVTVVAALWGGMNFGAQGADSASAGKRPGIYDAKADAAKQIAEALGQAKREQKRVLLQFGANWCGWCHKLHGLFEKDATIAKALKDHYVVVLVDVDKNHNAEVVKRYDNPTRFGLPVMVVLDSDGKALITQDTGKLEEGDHHSPEKVLAFLGQWKPVR